MPTGAELFVHCLKQLGITHIFTLVGDHLNEVLSTAEKERMAIVHMRHESGVTHAADTWARLHRRPAISLVTGGPGHTNSLTGLATAYQVGSPLIAVSGAPSTALAGRQVFQVIDQTGMAAPVTKWTAQPSAPGQIPYFLGRAWNEAISGRMGPVHLTVPVNVFEGQAAAPMPMPTPLGPTVIAPADRDVGRALDLLRRAERPVVIGGSGLWWGDAGRELNEFLALSGLPYYDVTLARGLITNPGARHMGYADPALNKAVRKAFPEADVVLVLGKRIDSRLAMGGPRLFSPQAKFIQVDIHPAELGVTRQLELGISADCRSTLAAMTAALGGQSAGSHSAWLKTLDGYRGEWEKELASAAADETEPIHPAAFFRVLRDHLPDNVMYSWDGGDFVHWGRATMPANNPGGWTRLGPLATIGSALPNSVAMQIEWPDRPVVMITGDGSLGFYIAEFDTLVRYNLPVVIVVGNDAGWGLERELQSELCGSTAGCELRSTRYDAVMKGFGGDGETIDTLDDVVPALERALQSRRPYVLNVNVRGARSPFTEWQLSGKKK